MHFYAGVLFSFVSRRKFLKFQATPCFPCLLHRRNQAEKGTKSFPKFAARNAVGSLSFFQTKFFPFTQLFSQEYSLIFHFRSNFEFHLPSLKILLLQIEIALFYLSKVSCRLCKSCFMDLLEYQSSLLQYPNLLVKFAPIRIIFFGLSLDPNCAISKSRLILYTQ